MLRDNLDEVLKNVKNACDKSSRNTEDITILGVTKTIEVDKIKQIINLGITNLGENRVQEFLPKFQIIGENGTWHLIGHLQTNKVRYIIGKVTLIHSVDSVKLAFEIDKYAKKHNIVQDILLEINIGLEESKHGINPEEIDNIIAEVVKLSNIRIRGLMTVAPFVEKGWENRENFIKMRTLLVDSNKKFINNISMDTLSMGMSSDYEVAIEEGATIVRIGQGLFGKR